jgi:heme/copper-type cytochrome/quinol oxidase subunit 2
MRFIRRFFSTAVALALLMGVAGTTVTARAEHHAGEAGTPAEGRVIQVISALVGGKNVYIPSTIVVAAGAPVRLSLFNTTDTPHGFRIADLGIEKVLPSREEVEVQLPALEGGRILEIDCHLHPPHRNGTLAVMPAH